jgi:23S rRNA G2445 N2-methylase RlmL
MDFYATAARGTEGPLGDELRELGFADVRQQGSGVAFRGERADGWRACLESRIAQRIQKQAMEMNGLLDKAVDREPR